MTTSTVAGRSMQEDQESLIERAEAMPGVVELAALYERVEPFGRYDIQTTTTHVTYGVGGNA